MEKALLSIFFTKFFHLTTLPVATIGTLGIKTQRTKKSNLTSLDVISLHKELSALKEKKN